MAMELHIPICRITASHQLSLQLFTTARVTAPPRRWDVRPVLQRLHPLSAPKTRPLVPASPPPQIHPTHTPAPSLTEGGLGGLGTAGFRAAPSGGALTRPLMISYTVGSLFINMNSSSLG